MTYEMVATYTQKPAPVHVVGWWFGRLHIRADSERAV